MLDYEWSTAVAKSFETPHIGAQKIGDMREGESGRTRFIINWL